MERLIKSIGLTMVVLGFAGLTVAQDPVFDLTVDAPGSLIGVAGDPIQYEAMGVLTTTGLADTDDGAQGWSLSIAVSGGALLDATTDGTAAAPVADGGLFVDGFNKTETIDPADNGGQIGAVSAIVLAFTEAVTLPPEGSSNLLKLTVEATVPEPGVDGTGDPTCEPAEVTIEYVNGLIGSGQPVDNKVTYQGATVLPSLGSAATSICPKIVKPLTFVTGVVAPESEPGASEGVINIPVAIPAGLVPVEAGIILSSRIDTGGEICDNGEDDDDDTLIDADDPDCAGAQGWSVSVLTEPCFAATEATTAGTAVDDYFAGGFNKTEIVDPTKNAGQEGAVTAIVLSFTEKRELPPVSDSVVLIVTGSLDGSSLVTAEDVGAPCNVSPAAADEAGLIGAGQPVKTAVTVAGVTRSPAVLGADLVLVPVQEGFVRGNANNDEKVDIADPIWIINELFREGEPSICQDAADANDDGLLDLSDAVFLIDFQFLGGVPPDAPYPTCGQDPTDDELDCGVLQPICSS